MELQEEGAPKYLIDELKQLIQQEEKALQARSYQPADETQVGPQELLERLNSNHEKRKSDCGR